MPPTKQSEETRKLISEKLKAAWRERAGSYAKRNKETSVRMTGNRYAFKRGFYRHAQGYWLVLKKDHPRAKQNRGYVKRCVLVMEKLIGRYLLPGETVHHINENKEDDRPENLYLFVNQAEHLRFHHRHGVRRLR